MRKSICAAALALSLAACQAPGDGGFGSSGGGQGMGTSTTTGALVGAIAGGAAGSRFGGGTGKLITTGVGTLGGALLGGMLGRSVEPSDEVQAQAGTVSALEQAPVGETIQWSNPDTGNVGTVTPMRQYSNNQGQTCREFRQTINVGGRVEQGFGTACQQPDGRWRIVS